MKCPTCESADTAIIATIPVETIVWRRRQCKACNCRWWTSEIEDEPLTPIWGEKHHENTICGVEGLQNPGA